MKTLLKMLLLVLAAQALACGRHVVLEPDKAAQKNSEDWTIQQKPQTASAQTGS